MLSAIFPINCLGCGAIDEFLCQSCVHAEIFHNPAQRPGFSFISGFKYEGLFASALGRLKNQSEYGYANRFAEALKNQIDFDSRVETLVPPSTNSAMRKRGFNPAASIAKKSGFKVTNKLRRIRQSDSQRGLDFQARQRNSNRLFELRERGEFLIFDDVVTTGATIREMIRAVEEQSGRVLGVFALCSTETKGANYE